ncbi:PMEI superfamily protein precursor [Trifolium repens]|nr:PMEI superfamily protein precursor [Trifolium repens]
MNPFISFSVFFTILVIFISPATSQKPGTGLYENVCNGVHEKQRCLKLAENNPELTSAKDYLTLSRSFLKMSIEKSTKGQNYLKNLVNKYPSSKALKECSTNCYNACVGDFKGSLEELTEDPLSASYDAFVAGDEPNRCDKLLADEKIVNDPSISTLNNEMKFLSFLANEIITHLQ